MCIKNYPAIYRLVAMLLLLMMIGGCASGGAAIRYYLVDPVDYPNLPTGVNDTLVIEILDIHIPQYLERFHIAVRQDDQRLYFSLSNQWGENLRKNLLRTLARNLSALLMTNDVATPLNRSMSLPDYRIQVHIEQFERDHDGRVKLVARWQISGSAESTSLEMHKAELNSPAFIAADNYDQIVTAMQSLFGQLSETIAQSVISAENRVIEQSRI